MVDKIFYAFVVNESSINRLFSQRFVAIKLRSVVDELNINPQRVEYAFIQSYESRQTVDALRNANL